MVFAIDRWVKWKWFTSNINGWRDSGTRSSRRASDGTVAIELAHDLLGARSVMIAKKVLSCFWEDVRGKVSWWLWRHNRWKVCGIERYFQNMSFSPFDRKWHFLGGRLLAEILTPRLDWVWWAKEIFFKMLWLWKKVCLGDPVKKVLCIKGKCWF